MNPENINKLYQQMLEICKELNKLNNMHISIEAPEGYLSFHKKAVGNEIYSNNSSNLVSNLKVKPKKVLGRPSQILAQFGADSLKHFSKKFYIDTTRDLFIKK